MSDFCARLLSLSLVFLRFRTCLHCCVAAHGRTEPECGHFYNLPCWVDCSRGKELLSHRMGSGDLEWWVLSPAGDLGFA